MKTFYLIFLLVGIAAAKNFSQLAQSDTKSRYFIIASHPPEECLKAMEEMKAKGDNYLSTFDFGCLYGDHTFYGVIEGESEVTVRKSLPPMLQMSARVKKVDKLNAAGIEKMHNDRTDAGKKIK